MSRSCLRVMSPAGASSLTTSAPSQASNCVAEGPDCTCVMSRTRMPSRALVVTWVTSLVHGLVHGSGGVRVRVDPDVDQRGLPGLAGASQRGADVGGIADLLAVTAQHLRELVVVDVA